MEYRRRAPVLRSKNPSDEEVAPASRSMHQSSLYHKDNFELPMLRALDAVQSALESDEKSQNLKYDTEEPNCRSARFCVHLPRSPQHQKYCYINMNGRSGGEASACSSGLPAEEIPKKPALPRPCRPDALKNVRFNKHSLHLFFRQVDRSQTGFATHRALMVALHNWFNEKLGDVGVAREAVNWLREIAKEADVEGTGAMSWKEFLEFFRRAGLLLEREDDQAPLESLKEIMQDAQDQMRSINFQPKCISDGHAKMQSEIKTTVGAAQAARFNKNKRTASPTRGMSKPSMASVPAASSNPAELSAIGGRSDPTSPTSGDRSESDMESPSSASRCSPRSATSAY